MSRFTQRKKTVPFVPPIDSTGTAQGGNYSFISLKNYQRAEITVFVGNIAGDSALTFLQAKNVEGNGSKALSFTKIEKCQSRAGSQEDADKFVEEAVTGDSYTIAAASHDNHMFKVVINADDLDVDNGFDCFRPNLGTPGANAYLVAVIIDLHDPRYRGDQENVNVLPSALKN
jgi:hypothetical protein